MNKLVEVFKCHAGLIADSEKSLSQIWVKKKYHLFIFKKAFDRFLKYLDVFVTGGPINLLLRCTLF